MSRAGVGRISSLTAVSIGRYGKSWGLHRNRCSHLSRCSTYSSLRFLPLGTRLCHRSWTLFIICASGSFVILSGFYRLSIVLHPHHWCTCFGDGILQGIPVSSCGVSVSISSTPHFNLSAPLPSFGMPIRRLSSQGKYSLILSQSCRALLLMGCYSLLTLVPRITISLFDAMPSMCSWLSRCKFNASRTLQVPVNNPYSYTKCRQPSRFSSSRRGLKKMGVSRIFLAIPCFNVLPSLNFQSIVESPLHEDIT